MIQSTDVGLAEPEAIGEFLVPAVMATADKPGPDSWADFTVEVPRDGDFICGADSDIPRCARIISDYAGRVVMARVGHAGVGGSGVGVRQWHWDSHGAGRDASRVPTA